MPAIVWCRTRPKAKNKRPAAPAKTVLLPCASVGHAFAAIAALFYPDASRTAWTQADGIDPTARLGRDVQLGPGVVIGAGADIGDGTRIGANAVIGAGRRPSEEPARSAAMSPSPTPISATGW